MEELIYPTEEQFDLFSFNWRETTPKNVREAIDGSILGSLCTALSKFYTPAAPLPIVLIQAIVLTGMALTHRRSKKSDSNPCNCSAAHLSDVYINTMFGNVPNIFAMIVAPSGAGKGQIPTTLFSAVQYQSFGNASLEGIKDAAMLNPHILISIQELGQYLSGRGYKGNFKAELTDMFNVGSFSDACSQSKRHGLRQAEWFFPSVYAAIQPAVLRNIGRALDISQGFFSRFLYGYMDESETSYRLNPCNHDWCNDQAMLCKRLTEISQLVGTVEVPNDNYGDAFLNTILPTLADEMIPIAKRYSYEYLPRIALMLSLPGINNTTRIEALPKITYEHIYRAEIVLYYILHMAERALGGLTDLDGRQRQNEDNLAKMVKIITRIEQKSNSAGVSVAEISRNSNGTGWDSKTRIHVLAEMAERGWCKVFYDGKDISNRIDPKTVSSLRGYKFTICREAIPFGVL